MAAGRRFGAWRGGAFWWLAGMLVSRLLFAGFLVFATYNPSGRSYVHWLRAGPAWQSSIWQLPTWQLITTVLLLLAYGVAIPVTIRALGIGGIALTASVAGAAIWVLLDSGLLSVAAEQAPVWIGLSVAATVLGTGLSWMNITTALDGQLSTRDLSR